MLLDVETFRRRTSYELDGLIEDLVRETHRSTPAERNAWKSSLPAFRDVLARPELANLHVHVGRPSSLMVEYRLPASPSWADLVLLGRGPNGPAAVVVELKDWNIAKDQSGDREALVRRPHGEDLHPSDQVRGYVEYCRRFHSAVQECGARVEGCVYFTYASSADAYVAEPHRKLVDEYPVFAKNIADVEERFPRYLANRLTAADPEFAQSFARGVYRQDRGFVVQISKAIQRSEERPFVLLDQQRRGFELCMACVERRLKPARVTAKTPAASSLKNSPKKSVVVIEGPPGSGKSVIAAQLWASIASDEAIDGNVVLTTTSTAQRTNWEELFHRVNGDRSARGVVIGSNQYNPGLNQPWLKRERANGFPTAIADWRQNVKRFCASHAQLKCADDDFAVSIVDEAHALIDPTVADRKGMSASGWMLHAGPQAWHVIRASRVAVFLMDPEQSYRDNETTSIARLQQFADDFGADFTRISLAGSQFRCSGSTEYLAWIDKTLAIQQDESDGAPQSVATAAGGSVSTQVKRVGPWRKSAGGPYEFEVFDTPFDLESALRPHESAGRSVRFVASYSRKWKTKGIANPHRLAASAQDFCIVVDTAGRGAKPSAAVAGGGASMEPRTWSRVWNYTPKEDYSIFIQAPEGTAIARDQLCEVGCPYVLRGFDFDYVGLLWMSDLVWRGDRWKVNLEHVHESAWRLAISGARKRKPGAEDDVIRRLQRGYRILLSRAMRGTYIWFEDAETREHIERSLKA